MLAFNSIQNLFVQTILLSPFSTDPVSPDSIVDAFFPYSAAAVAGATAVRFRSLLSERELIPPQLRSVVACILPEFSSDLFTNLGWGWGGTLLALISMIAVPAPMVVRHWARTFPR